MKNLSVSPDLQALLSVKNELCVTLVVPLHEHPSQKRNDRLALDHAISRLEDILLGRYEQELVSVFIDKLKSVGDDLSRVTGSRGLGIFISRDVFKVVAFPFEVKERIHAGSTFEVRDVLYRDNLYAPYRVLAITRDRLRLYNGSGPHLTEVTDQNFPAEYSQPESDFSELEVAAQNLSATTRREKALTMESPHAFLNAVDRKLGLYVEDRAPLLLAGVQKEMAAFERSTSHAALIRGKVQGSYNGYNHQELETKCWEHVQQLLSADEDQLILSLNELFGRELVSIGLQDVWRNAKMGKGSMLVVERDLSMPAFQTADGFQVWLSPPADKHELLSDAVDDLIETVLSMDGKVTFVGNGKLREFNGIAMIHRY